MEHFAVDRAPLPAAFTASVPFSRTIPPANLSFSSTICRNVPRASTLRRRAHCAHPQMVTAPTPSERKNAPSDKQSPSPVQSTAPAADFFAAGSFASLGLSVKIVSVLSAAHITRPTPIQSRGIPPILSGADVILGAATGSGKTLAYLLPVIEMLKSAEALRLPTDPALRVSRRPRALILVPTRELAEQTLSVAKKLSHAVKFRALGAIGGGSGSVRRLKDLLAASPVDVLVGTTGRIAQLISERAIDLRFATHIVVDEVDTMFDAGFGPELRRILAAARKGRAERGTPRLQCVSAGATHPRKVQDLYAAEFPTAVRIDADLHRAPPGLTQRFVSVTAKTKLQELIALLGEARRDGGLRGGRIIVFCNTMDSCRFLDHTLRESGYITSCIHGDVPSSRREEEYAAFRGARTQLLVCTDMAARGLDNLQVDHVILFDFPTSAVDYIHRAGRTARAGARGLVTSLVMRKDERLANAIQKAHRGKSDTLESARVAREEEMQRKTEEEARAREAQRNQAAAAWNGDAPLEAVPFASATRYRVPRGAPGGRGRGRPGSTSRFSARGRGGSAARRGRSSRSGSR